MDWLQLLSLSVVMAIPIGLGLAVGEYFNRKHIEENRRRFLRNSEENRKLLEK